MSSPFLSPDTKAILHAAEALTAQVRRVADALTTPVMTPTSAAGEAIEAEGPPCNAVPGCDGQCCKHAEATTSPLREQLADTLACFGDVDQYAMADAVLAKILPTTRLLGELHRSAHEDVKRVIALYEEWVKAGPPPLGTPVSRWWDTRLAELRAAILPPEPQTKEH